MKSLIVFCFTLLLTSSHLFSQVKFGIRGGLSTTQISDVAIKVEQTDGSNDWQLNLEEVNYGYHFGIFVQAGKKFFIQPELLFNSSSADYRLGDENGNDIGKGIFEETYRSLDLPVMLGMRFAFLRVQAGPVAHFHIDSSSELVDISAYKEKFETFTYGYQAGLGIDFWKLVLDLKYEGNFSKYGDHITFFNRAYEFDKSPARLIATLGIHF